MHKLQRHLHIVVKNLAKTHCVLDRFVLKSPPCIRLCESPERYAVLVNPSFRFIFSLLPTMPSDDQPLSTCAAATVAALPSTTAPAPSPEPKTTSDRLALLVREGCRTLLLRAPRWNRVTAEPLMLVLLAGLLIACTIALQRVVVSGPVYFYWQAIAGGWVDMIALAWAAYLVTSNSGLPGNRLPAPGAAQLLMLMLMQSLLVSVPFSLTALLLRAATATAMAITTPGATMAWLGSVGWVVATLWVTVANGWLLLRHSNAIRRSLMAVAALLLGTAGATLALPGQQFWYPIKANESDDNRQLHLSQPTIEAQQTATTAAFAAILPQRPGVIDVYGLTFAPYAEESVFRKESGIVAEVLAKRFDAAGRTMQLVNHRDTYAQFPWATPWNLQRAIQRMAALMDRDEDILFLHVTSHGARNGTLSADFWPLEVEQITPVALKGWLDAAGVRYRVLSISACYAGAWIDALANDTTLVMTASDATHTSYGCGSKSELTFFGRAMYDEQLRNQTLSFEQAFATSREVIRVREVEVGKDDGYSNPQIRMGVDIRGRLKQLQSELAVRKS